MKEMDEFDLSDITANPKEPTQEEIIAAAEEAAFAGQEQKKIKRTSIGVLFYCTYL